LTGINVTKAANGFTFDIPEQTDGDGLTLEGFEMYELNGKKYDALYDKNDKTFSFAIAFEHEGVMGVVAVIGTKVEEE
jgi:hypothetical protein